MDMTVVVPLAVFFGISFAAWALLGSFGNKENRGRRTP